MSHLPEFNAPSWGGSWALLAVILPYFFAFVFKIDFSSNFSRFRRVFGRILGGQTTVKSIKRSMKKAGSKNHQISINFWCSGLFAPDVRCGFRTIIYSVLLRSEEVRILAFQHFLAFKKRLKIRAKIGLKRFKIVSENHVFFDVDFLSIWGGFGRVLGRVLGGVWGFLSPLGRFSGLFFGCLHLECSLEGLLQPSGVDFGSILKALRAPERVQESSERVPNSPQRRPKRGL